ncbi:MAG: hypothetical protein HY391_00730 [Deltaproteobacteria bacterium]|nr:hypothetical protein [Deltaproteobacteria bacterium]
MKKVVFFLFSIFLVGLLYKAIPAEASHPSPGDMDQVIRLAEQVYRQSDYAYRIAYARRHHYTERERHALEQLQFFKEAAYHFFRQVTSFRNDPEHTEHDYDRLIDAFAQADITFGDLHPTRSVVRAWSRVRQAMDHLELYYEGSVEPDPDHATSFLVPTGGANLSTNAHSSAAAYELRDCATGQTICNSGFKNLCGGQNFGQGFHQPGVFAYQNPTNGGTSLPGVTVSISGQCVDQWGNPVPGQTVSYRGSANTALGSCTPIVSVRCP